MLMYEDSAVPHALSMSLQSHIIKKICWSLISSCKRGHVWSWISPWLPENPTPKRDVHPSCDRGMWVLIPAVEDWSDKTRRDRKRRTLGVTLSWDEYKSEVAQTQEESFVILERALKTLHLILMSTGGSFNRSHSSMFDRQCHSDFGI